MVSKPKQRPDAYLDEVVSFVSEKVEEAGADGVVVGLSGGIDSAASSSVAVEALGKENVRGLVLPSGPSEDRNMRDAKEHAEKFGIEYEVIDIQPVVESFLDEYPKSVGNREAKGNLRARVRMCYNYLVANDESLLVLGTGNRSEILIGYYTKYGDGGVDILPLGGLYKTEVRQLARELGVDEGIIEKSPTAGLWEGQTDEDELGASYDEIDTVLSQYVDEGSTIEETVEATDLDEDTVEELVSMHHASAHKRKTPPYPDLGRKTGI